jgi:hypothetical protein
MAGPFRAFPQRPCARRRVADRMAPDAITTAVSIMSARTGAAVDAGVEQADAPRPQLGCSLRQRPRLDHTPWRLLQNRRTT